MHSEWDNDEAVSPVIATVLLLAITIMLTGAIFVWVQGSIAIEKAPPRAEVTTRAIDGGYQVVRFQSIEPEIPPSMLKFQIVPSDSVDGRAISGNASDSHVYGRVGTAVSFHDRDAAFTVSPGDYFVINATLAGTDRGEWFIQLTHMGTNTQLAFLPLPTISTT